jgi:hypothetical protein
MLRAPLHDLEKPRREPALTLLARYDDSPP